MSSPSTDRLAGIRAEIERPKEHIVNAKAEIWAFLDTNNQFVPFL